jgi:hypothetical protein
MIFSALYPDISIDEDLARMEELPSFLAIECAVINFDDTLYEDNQ